jgi:hypothetical protein
MPTPFFHDVVGSFALDVRNEADATGIVLKNADRTGLGGTEAAWIRVWGE